MEQAHVQEAARQCKLSYENPEELRAVFRYVDPFWLTGGLFALMSTGPGTSDEATETTYVVFRGTSEVGNWFLTNCQAFEAEQPFGQPELEAVRGRLHQGFLRAFLYLWSGEDKPFPAEPRTAFKYLLGLWFAVAIPLSIAIIGLFVFYERLKTFYANVKGSLLGRNADDVEGWRRFRPILRHVAELVFVLSAMVVVSLLWCCAWPHIPSLLRSPLLGKPLTLLILLALGLIAMQWLVENGHFEGMFSRGEMLKLGAPLRDVVKNIEARRIVFTGHSLGGAMAMLAFILCFEQNKKNDVSRKKDLMLVMFGAPRVGDDRFVDWFLGQEEYQNRYLLLAHNGDPVAHVPPSDYLVGRACKSPTATGILLVCLYGLFWRPYRRAYGLGKGHHWRELVKWGGTHGLLFREHAMSSYHSSIDSGVFPDAFEGSTLRSETQAGRS
jgi:hypothetical protein